MDDTNFRDMVSTGMLGLTGRLLALSHHDRRPFGWSLLWEIPLAIGMATIGRGCAEYVHLDGFANDAMTISIAYLGPRLIDVTLAKWTR